LSNTHIKTKAEPLEETQGLQEIVNGYERASQNTSNLLQSTEMSDSTWLEHSPVCTKIVSANSNLIYMSSAGVKALKIDDITPYYGKPYPFYFFPKSFKDTMNEHMLNVKTSGKDSDLEAAVVDIDGSELWFHSTLVPVNDGNGELDYIIIVSIEITNQKRAEIDLRQLNRKLEITVTDRTLELEKANARLKLLSETDPLTNIANRRAYENRISKEVAFAKRTKTYLALLMIDIDYFKRYNDYYGHVEGDIVLKLVAKIMCEALPRATDMAIRFGGEEFLVLLPSTNVAGAVEVAEKIRKNIETSGIEHLQSMIESILTVSIGVSALKNEELTEKKLLRQADDALYKSKNNGRNRTELF